MDIDAISHLPVATFNWTAEDAHLWDLVIKEYTQDTLFTHKNPFTIVLIVLYSLAFLIGFLGNTLVIFVVARHKSMRTLTNTFLVNLAIGDLMVILICVPMTLGRYVYENWIYGEAMCKLTPFIQGVSVSVSVLTLLAIGLDRYFAITRPMTARLIFSKRKVNFILIGIWFLSAVIFLPFLIINSTMREQVMTLEVIHCREHWSEVESKQSYNLIIFITLYVIPLMILTGCYIKTGTTLWYGDTTLQQAEDMSGAQQRVLKGRQRVVKMLISIVVLFAISWLPYHVINIWLDFEFDGDIRSRLSGIANYAYPVSQWLGLANSASNPLCYCFMSKSFRTAFLAAFRCSGRIPTFGSSIRSRSTRRVPGESLLFKQNSVSDGFKHNGTIRQHSVKANFISIFMNRFKTRSRMPGYTEASGDADLDKVTTVI